MTIMNIDSKRYENRRNLGAPGDHRLTGQSGYNRSVKMRNWSDSPCPCTSKETLVFHGFFFLSVLQFDVGPSFKTPFQILIFSHIWFECINQITVTFGSLPPNSTRNAGRRKKLLVVNKMVYNLLIIETTSKYILLQ